MPAQKAIHSKTDIIIEGERKIFHDKSSVKQFIFAKPCLQSNKRECFKQKRMLNTFENPQKMIKEAKTSDNQMKTKETANTTKSTNDRN